MCVLKCLWEIFFGREEESHGRNDGDYYLTRPLNQRFSPATEASASIPLPSSSSVVHTKLSSLSEKKPPISAEPSTRSPAKPHESCSSFRVSPDPSIPLSKASPSPPAPPMKTSPSPFPSSCSAAAFGYRVKSSFTITSPSEKKPPISTESSKRSLEKPGETSPPSIFSPSPSLPSPQVSSPSPPLPLKASRKMVNVSQSLDSSGLSPLSKASPPPPPLKLPESDEGLPEPPKIEQRSRYEIPKHLKELIEKDMVPPVLRRPLSPSSYADYFGTLLYSEDFYLEKWSNYLLSEITLELRHDVVFQIQNSREGKKIKDFVAFEIDSVPERRPYLLSGDFVYVQPSREIAGPFKGILFRVVKSTTVLVEFGDDFYKQHSPTKKYDVSFSFKKVCLEQFHQAVSTAMDPLLHKIIFPDPSSRSSFLNLPSSKVPAYRSSSHGQLHVVNRILNLKGPLPYLIEGPVSETREGTLSGTGTFIREAVLQIYRTCAHCRILVCAPRNRTCDALMEKWMLDIPKSKLFCANAAFREYHLVPDDIIPACLHEGELFTCPPLSELQRFKVITSTFLSSFRLHAAGIEANHFTHIFLVDASSATEPETLVALANLVSNKTVIVITGSSIDIPAWVRSDIARWKGLKKSLFHRLLQMEPYSTKDPMFMTHIV
uniref:Probable RNA helicase SDE3 n=1 Tax=Elaeis guineensis var. tenera TaxID=51953 RepID=A0A6I9R0U9_ELAGV|nr:probable RNA helicase SDE3 [Elaeis guineensis]